MSSATAMTRSPWSDSLTAIHWDRRSASRRTDRAWIGGPWPRSPPPPRPTRATLSHGGGGSRRNLRVGQHSRGRADGPGSRHALRDRCQRPCPQLRGGDAPRHLVGAADVPPGAGGSGQFGQCVIAGTRIGDRARQCHGATGIAGPGKRHGDFGDFSPLEPGRVAPRAAVSAERASSPARSRCPSRAHTSASQASSEAYRTGIPVRTSASARRASPSARSMRPAHSSHVPPRRSSGPVLSPGTGCPARLP